MLIDSQIKKLGISHEQVGWNTDELMQQVSKMPRNEDRVEKYLSQERAEEVNSVIKLTKAFINCFSELDPDA